jgi:DNA-binding YbaB/EbfC family protein
VKNLTDLMKQAQEMQGKMQEVQQRLAASLIEGSSGGGMVRVTMKGTGELAAVNLDESLLRPGEGEMISDLLIAAHADAKRKMDARQAELLREVAGPLAGLPGMPF